MSIHITHVQLTIKWQRFINDTEYIPVQTVVIFMIYSVAQWPTIDIWKPIKFMSSKMSQGLQHMEYNVYITWY